MAGLGAGINRIKNLRLLARIVTGLGKTFPPVWIFDDYVNFRIYLFCRADNQVAGNFQHLFKTEFFPAAVPLLADTVFALTLSKKEIIYNKLIKLTCSIFADFLKAGPHRLVAVTEGIKKALTFFVAFIEVWSNGCNSAGNFNSVILHNPLEHIKLLFFSKLVAVSFQIDFIYADIFL